MQDCKSVWHKRHGGKERARGVNEDGGESEYIELDLERRLASCLCICCGKVKGNPKRKEQKKEKQPKPEKITEPPAQVTKEQQQQEQRSGDK